MSRFRFPILNRIVFVIAGLGDSSLEPSESKDGKTLKILPRAIWMSSRADQGRAQEI